MARWTRRGCGVGASIVLLAGLAGCGADEEADQAREADGPMAIVVDTDLGIDDVLALAFLTQRPDVELRAVTLSGVGVARCDPGLQDLAALLDELGAADVPIACGREAPTVGEAAYPDDQRDLAAGLFGLSVADPGVEPVASAGSAGELIASEVRAGATTVLALGPLTNVADAMAEDPGLAEEVDRIVAMAGAVSVPGNVQSQGVLPASEWNVYIDPEAAQAVLDSGVTLELVPLDATSDLPLDAAFAEATMALPASPAASIAQELLIEAPFTWRGGTFSLWDPLAAVLLLEPELAEVDDTQIRIGLGASDWGATLAGESGATVSYVVSADGPTAAGALLAAWAADGRSIRPLADLPADVVVDAADGCAIDPDGAPAGDLLISLRGPGSPVQVVVLAITGDQTAADLEPLAEGFDGTIPSWLSLVAAWTLPDDAPVHPTLELGAGRYAVVCADLRSAEVTVGGVLDVG